MNVVTTPANDAETTIKTPEFTPEETRAPSEITTTLDSGTGPMFESEIVYETDGEEAHAGRTVQEAAEDVSTVSSKNAVTYPPAISPQQEMVTTLIPKQDTAPLGRAFGIPAEQNVPITDASTFSSTTLPSSNIEVQQENKIPNTSHPKNMSSPHYTVINGTHVDEYIQSLTTPTPVTTSERDPDVARGKQIMQQMENGDLSYFFQNLSGNK